MGAQRANVFGKRKTCVKVRSSANDEGKEDANVATRNSEKVSNEMFLNSFEPEEFECVTPNDDGTCSLEEYEAKQDFFRAFGVGISMLLGAYVLDHDWVEAHTNATMIAIFLL
eukprot:2929724-Pyramimonas_sp.AAC.1